MTATVGAAFPVGYAVESITGNTSYTGVDITGNTSYTIDTHVPN
jgi:hypothetical protein